MGKNGIYQMMSSGELPPYSIRGRLLVAKSDLIDYLLEHCDDNGNRSQQIASVLKLRSDRQEVTSNG